MFWDSSFSYGKHKGTVHSYVTHDFSSYHIHKCHIVCWPNLGIFSSLQGTQRVSKNCNAIFITYVVLMLFFQIPEAKYWWQDVTVYPWYETGKIWLFELEFFVGTKLFVLSSSGLLSVYLALVTLVAADTKHAILTALKCAHDERICKSCQTEYRFCSLYLVATKMREPNTFTQNVGF